jgi:hypothetical protein
MSNATSMTRWQSMPNGETGLDAGRNGDQMTTCEPGCGIAEHLHAAVLPPDIAEGLAYLAWTSEIGEQPGPESFQAWRERRAASE